MIVSMRRTRWPVSLGVGLVLLAVIGAAVFLMNRSSAAAAPNPGPIRWGFPSGVSGWAYPDKPFYFGGAAVINHDPAGRPAILERVALLAPSNGLRIDKAYTTRPNQQTITATGASLPPRAGETLYPFTGAKVPAQPRGDEGSDRVWHQPGAERPGYGQDPHLRRDHPQVQDRPRAVPGDHVPAGTNLRNRAR
jgi:hypothetical protein